MVSLLFIFLYKSWWTSVMVNVNFFRWILDTTLGANQYFFAYIKVKSIYNDTFTCISVSGLLSEKFSQNHTHLPVPEGDQKLLLSVQLQASRCLRRRRFPLHLLSRDSPIIPLLLLKFRINEVGSGPENVSSDWIPLNLSQLKYYGEYRCLKKKLLKMFSPLVIKHWKR